MTRPHPSNDNTPKSTITPPPYVAQPHNSAAHTTSATAAEEQENERTTAHRHTADVEDALLSHQSHLQALFPVPPARSKRHAVKRLGGSVLVVALSAGLWWLNPSYRSEEWASTTGQVQHIALADGSQLTLDTASHVHIQWRLRSREVLLQEGRAHFDVTPATWRPFIVRAADIQVRVVGTRFDVWRHRTQTTVTVQEGVVDVQQHSTAQHAPPVIRLTAGQAITASIGLPAHEWEAMQPQTMHSPNATAWQKGQLVFEHTPLRQVIADIQRYHPYPIRLIGDAPDALPVSGVFHTNQTDELLNQLGQILPIDVRKEADQSVNITIR